MDAVKFIEERNRMCGTMSEVWGVDAEQIVKNTEKWSNTHPRKTRQSEFLKQWPNAQVADDTGTLSIYPCVVDKDMNNDQCPGKNCLDCRREFWMQEVE